MLRLSRRPWWARGRPGARPGPSPGDGVRRRLTASIRVGWIYRVTAAMLLATAALTAVTGARTRVVWFKICPVLLGVTAALLLAASWV